MATKIFWLTIFIAPLYLWHMTSDIYRYFLYGAPAGQIWYVLSKLLDLYGALLLWYQVLSSLLRTTVYANALPRWTCLHHRILGSLILLIITGHITFFVTDVSLRRELFVWQLLLPDVRDFYHTAITVGLFGFLIAIVAVIAAVLRKYLAACWKTIHRSMLVVVALGLVHGFLIGTETRYGFYEIFYCALMVSLFIALILRWRQSQECA
ncbi:hypothetical protein AB835_09680 [Candidatus Endobugula sertula]|uniref:Ferric oxidoreductase domain-containing protein n=1 Tax=Candidatus Endobugula sertula TaxID=62101 RepID=A0A1D2QNX2_9GAMM|nr:hypothetical protein AB835_09680 [Candidatus Endobugula sertula]